MVEVSIKLASLDAYAASEIKEDWESPARSEHARVRLSAAGMCNRERAPRSTKHLTFLALPA